MNFNDIILQLNNTTRYIYNYIQEESEAFTAFVNQITNNHPPGRSGDPLYEAIYSGKVKKVRALLNAGVSIESNCPTESPIFSFCLRFGTMEILEELFKNGVDIHDIDADGNTALHYFAMLQDEAHHRMLPALINAGANINATNNRGLTPLHIALRNNHDHIVLGLLNAGAANIHDVNERGLNTLHIAAKHADHRIAMQLINARDKNIDAIDNEGLTPLHHAAKSEDLAGINNQSSSVATVISLICKGANIEAVDYSGRKPQEYALGDRKIAFEHPLHMAAKYCDIETVQSLVEKGYDVNCLLDEKKPLEIAIANNNYKPAFYLTTLTDNRFEDLKAYNNSTYQSLLKQYEYAIEKRSNIIENYSSKDVYTMQNSIRYYSKALFRMNSTLKAKAILSIKIGMLKSGEKDAYIMTQNFLRWFPNLRPETINHIIGFVGLYDAKVDLNDIMSDLSPRSSKAILNQVVLKQTRTTIIDTAVKDYCTIS